MAGGGFSAAVWALARRVPPGRATTYGLLAEAHYGGVGGVGGTAGVVPRSTAP
jgi:O6-methylguanine-DNA--protein-cysteine methyltransferase